MLFRTIIIYLMIVNVHSMSIAEAIFRCQTSIIKSEEISKNFKNSESTSIAKIALERMHKLLDSLSEGISGKNISQNTTLCIKQEEHILWLKDIDSSIINVKTENKQAKNTEKPSVGKKNIKKTKTVDTNQKKFDKTINEFIKKELNARMNELAPTL